MPRHHAEVSLTPFLGFSHIDVPVVNLERSLAIYRDATGFVETTRGEGWVCIDAVTAVIRLIELSKPEHRASMRLQAMSVEAACELLQRAGATVVYAPHRAANNELLGTLSDPDGHTIHVWRPLTEDEYDVIPEIPKELTWDPEAEELLKSLLLKVPALFRGLARRRTSKEAERLAGTTNLVGREEVIRGYILASPRLTRGRNRQPLIDHGIDVDKYKADWEAE